MSPAIALPEVDRIAITTVVDNFLDMLRADEKVARRFSIPRAQGWTKVRAEHGLAHWVEISRGAETHRIAFDFGLTEGCYVHNLRELGLDPGAIDALALSHGHLDHFGGLPGFLDTCRRSMRRDLALYAGVDHFLPRWFERDGQRVYLGRLDRDALERQDLAARQAAQIMELLEQNTNLTKLTQELSQRIEALTTEIHRTIVAPQPE